MVKNVEGGVVVAIRGRSLFFTREEAIALQAELAEATAEAPAVRDESPDERTCRTCKNRFEPDPLNRNSDLCKKCLSEGRL